MKNENKSQLNDEKKLSEESLGAWMDFLFQLPDELFVHTLSFMPPEVISNLLGTNKKVNDKINNLHEEFIELLKPQLAAPVFWLAKTHQHYRRQLNMGLFLDCLPLSFCALIFLMFKIACQAWQIRYQPHVCRNVMDYARHIFMKDRYKSRPFVMNAYLSLNVGEIKIVRQEINSMLEQTYGFEKLGLMFNFLVFCVIFGLMQMQIVDFTRPIPLLFLGFICTHSAYLAVALEASYEDYGNHLQKKSGFFRIEKTFLTACAARKADEKKSAAPKESDNEKAEEQPSLSLRLRTVSSGS